MFARLKQFGGDEFRHELRKGASIESEMSAVFAMSLECFPLSAQLTEGAGGDKLDGRESRSKSTLVIDVVNTIGREPKDARSHDLECDVIDNRGRRHRC